MGSPKPTYIKLKFKVRLETSLFHICRILVARQLASVGSGISVVDLGGPSVGVSWRQLGYRGTSKGLVLTYPASVGVS